MGSMRRGCSASVPVITHTSLQDTAGRSLQPPLCLLSVSPSRLNAFDCTAHHQAEVFAHRCITLCTAPSIYSPAQGAKEQWLRVSGPVSLSLWEQIWVTDHWREVRLVSGPSLWSWDQGHIILLQGSRADTGCLGHAGSSFSPEPKGPGVHSGLPFARGHIALLWFAPASSHPA